MESLETGSAAAWQYRSEGNASFVIFNLKTRTVLKLRKKNLKNTSQKEHCANWKRCCDFVQRIIVPLLGREYVSVPKMVPVTEDFLVSVAQRLASERPRKRLHTEIDTSQSYAILLPDLSLLQCPGKAVPDSPTFGLEIKPKWGFLKSPECISNFHDVTCRFCLHQHIKPKHLSLHAPCCMPAILAIQHSTCCFCLYQPYKVKRGVWEKLSRFCPLDFFSCDPLRMKYSLRMMLENPQNNLRIFKDGNVIYQVQEKSTPSLAEQTQLADHLRGHFGDDGAADVLSHHPLDSCCVQSFLDAAIKVLLAPSECQEKSSNTTENSLPKSRLSCKASRYNRGGRALNGLAASEKSSARREPAEASESCILRRLVAAQTLTSQDIHAVRPLYDRVLRHLEDNPQSRDDYPLDFPYDKRPPHQEDGIRDGQNGGIEVGNTSDLSIQSAVREIRKYMVTRTLRDSSIILAIQPVTGERPLSSYGVPYVQTSRGRSYLFSANVIDLDPKPSARIPSYERMENEVAREYLASLQNTAHFSTE